MPVPPASLKGQRIYRTPVWPPRRSGVFAYNARLKVLVSPRKLRLRTPICKSAGFARRLVLTPTRPLELGERRRTFPSPSPRTIVSKCLFYRQTRREQVPNRTKPRLRRKSDAPSRGQSAPSAIFACFAASFVPSFHHPRRCAGKSRPCPFAGFIKEGPVRG